MNGQGCTLHLPKRSLVREHVQGDNHQDGCGCQCRPTNDERRRVRTQHGERLPRGVRQFKVTVPFAQRRGAAGDQPGKWQSKQKHPQCPHAARVPHNDPLSGVHRFIV